jgi:hypothetical protein
MMAELEPYRRSEYNRALVANALLDSFAVVLLAAVLVAGIVLDRFLLMLPIAVVAYIAAAVRTYFDDDEAQKVLERERERRRRRLDRPRVDPRTLAPPIGRLLQEALEREARVQQAIDRAELPYVEVSEEVDGFVRAIEATAGRAQLLYEALADAPPARVEERLAQLRGEADPSRHELVEALEHQLAVARRMERQLQRFFDEMERILVELDTVRGSLVSVSASTEAASQQRLAAEVRGLREEVGSLAEGMSEAFEEQRPPAAG